MLHPHPPAHEVAGAPPPHPPAHQVAGAPLTHPPAHQVDLFTVHTIEEREKVVAAVWGMELIHFLDALVIFHQDGIEKRMNRIKGYLVEWMLWKNG